MSEIDGHKVEIEFDGLYPSVKLLHPEGGCPLPDGVCEECGADLQDPESKRCIACDGMRPGWCWVEDWVENEGHELLHGKITVAVEPEWDGDWARLHVASTQPDPPDLLQAIEGEIERLRDAAAQQRDFAIASKAVPVAESYRKRGVEIDDYADSLTAILNQHRAGGERS